MNAPAPVLDLAAIIASNPILLVIFTVVSAVMFVTKWTGRKSDSNVVIGTLIDEVAQLRAKEIEMKTRPPATLPELRQIIASQEEIMKRLSKIEEITKK